MRRRNRNRVPDYEDDCPYCDAPFRYEPEEFPPLETLTGLEKARRAVQISRGTYARPTVPLLFAHDQDETP